MKSSSVPISNLQAEIPSDTELQNLLQTRFALENFREGQLDILKTVLQNRDGLAVMPTGGGKSLCYQLPSLCQTGLVLVISPLIALMKDQVRSLTNLNISAGCLHSGQSTAEKQAVFAAIKTSKNFILYLSPERVQKEGFAPWLQKQKIALFAIDEAHCISQWGPDFREDYHRLKLLRDLRPEVPILALTATATPPVLWDIVKQLGLKKPDRHIHGFYRPNLFYQVEPCENDFVKNQWVRQALRQTPEGRVLIYCGTRKQCEALSESLQNEFAMTDFYHAGLDTEARTRIQQDYEAGRTRILAATNAFGMGIDHPDVRLVIHFQMPANVESLYQEMGRAGRDGKDSTCLMLYSKKDKGLHAYFITRSEADDQHIQRRWNALNTMVQFAEGGECRHAGILTYFRDARRLQACGHCDSCLPQSPRRIQQPEIPQSSLPKPKRPARSRGKDLFDGTLSEAAENRARKIREWRNQYARSRDIPAFLVFSNKTLKDLAHKNPQDLEALEQIYGLGPHKIEEFGKELLEAME